MVSKKDREKALRKKLRRSRRKERRAASSKQKTIVKRTFFDKLFSRPCIAGMGVIVFVFIMFIIVAPPPQPPPPLIRTVTLEFVFKVGGPPNWVNYTFGGMQRLERTDTDPFNPSSIAMLFVFKVRSTYYTPLGLGYQWYDFNENEWVFEDDLESIGDVELATEPNIFPTVAYTLTANRGEWLTIFCEYLDFGFYFVEHFSIRGQVIP